MKSAPLRIAFFAYVYNLAEVTRAVEVARALRERGVEIRFFTHGGTHENRIAEADFPLTTLQLLITLEKHGRLMDLDQGRTFGHPFSTAEWTAHVESEVTALREFGPTAVYAGMNLPSAISARAVGAPLIYLLPTPGIIPYFEHGLATWPESQEFWLTRLLPQRWKNGAINWVMPRVKLGTRCFNRVAQKFGVPPINTLWDVVSGDFNLLTDLPELTGLPAASLPDNYRYVGPIFAHLPLAVPEEVKRVFARPGLNIFCAMGSSAPPEFLQTAVTALRQTSYNIVIATTSILDPAELGPLPENMVATRYLPAPQVNEMADIAVIHGGQGTVQTACWAGTPVVGVGLQFEQEANLEMVVRAGMGARIPTYAYTPERVLAEVEQVANDERYRRNAQRIQTLVRATNGANNAANAILQFINGENNEST